MRTWIAVVSVLVFAGCLGDGQPSGSDADSAPPGESKKESAQVPGRDPEDRPVGQAPGEAPATPPTEEPGPPEPVVHHYNDTTGTEVATFIAGREGLGGGFALEFGVPKDATGLVFELVWDDPVQDMDMQVQGPTRCEPGDWPTYVDCALTRWTLSGEGLWWFTDGHVGAPDGPVRFVLEGEALEKQRCRSSDCTWYAGAWTKDVNIDLHFDLYATVFHTPIPDDYTATRPMPEGG